ncbi:MAG: hypothetical protein A3J93_02020 [Candidatus Magasanikbacteria bacterium RIFOXYC2_FULL_42_28]|uniref:Polysaccharide chain length determinant N-terminal domain-containing protein n=1 Tax=Candidatus Magasanikbacteria bacterium RIFOXYC2_FULL_42_28 TaxID=1798704 RepID=A0A1F6NX96_9BACT|nr:MAG: hypothetical protein A3J93_02020 [Candidatus Magasanikbacteria bacterium RIFOXYC2_FULL_42_28]
MFIVIQKHLKLIIVWGLIFAVLSVLVSLLFPKYFSAESQVLIISRDRTGVDPYTQAKAAERTGENLAAVMQTSDFYDKVMEEAEVSFDKTAWTGLTERARRKAWTKNVRAEMMYGTSLLKATVYASTREQALAFSDVVSKTIAARGWEYVGGDVAIKVVSVPYAKNWPSRPNLAMNGLAGFILGAVLSAWWAIKYRKHLFGKI